MPPHTAAQRAFGRRSLFLALAFLVATAAAACDPADGEERDFAEQISTENRRWVEQGERPLADLVLRLASQPAIIADRRGEVVAFLDSMIALNGESLQATRELQPPSDRAGACHEAQIERLEIARNWLGMLRLAIGQMADASATAMLPTFRDLAPTITRADELCSQFVEEAD